MHTVGTPLRGRPQCHGTLFALCLLTEQPAATSAAAAEASSSGSKAATDLASSAAAASTAERIGQQQQLSPFRQALAAHCRLLLRSQCENAGELAVFLGRKRSQNGCGDMCAALLRVLPPALTRELATQVRFRSSLALCPSGLCACVCGMLPCVCWFGLLHCANSVLCWPVASNESHISFVCASLRPFQTALDGQTPLHLLRGNREVSEPAFLVAGSLVTASIVAPSCQCFTG
jgi:hypothetical protein